MPREKNPIEEEIIDIFPDRVPVFPLEQEITLQNVISRKVLRGTRIDNENVLGDKPVSTYARAINIAGQARDVVDFSITETKLANLAVATRAIQDDAVTATKVWRGGAVITLSAQIGTAVVQDAHIANLSAIKITGQVVDAQIANINFAKIFNVVINNAHITDLNADKINAGTLTGRTIRTAASGERIELDSSFHDLNFFDSFGNLQGVIDSTTESIRLVSNIAGRSMWVAARDAGGILRWVISFFGDHIACNQRINPTSNNAFDLGTSTLRWRDLHLSGNITIAGTVDGVDVSAHNHSGAGHGGTISHGSIGGITADQHHSSTSFGIAITPASISTTGTCHFGHTHTYSIIPRTNNSFDLGGSTLRWRGLFLAPQTGNPIAPGNIVNFSSAGIEQFRGQPGAGTWRGRFDMTAV